MRASLRLRSTLASLLMALGAFPGFAALSVGELRCEGVREPQQVDTPQPRFGWRLESDRRDVRQVACQMRVIEVDGEGRAMAAAAWETPEITTKESQWVTPPGLTLRPRTAYAWQVRVWDNHGQASGWSEPQRFATGLMGESWPADWIGDGRMLPVNETAPARHFRRSFRLEQKPVRARLFVSAQGLVEPWLNGRLVTEDRFVPGWPDYRRRVFYAAFDVTALLRAGKTPWA